MASPRGLQIYRELVANSYRWRFPDADPVWDEYALRARYVGVHHLKDAIAEGRGVVCVGAHFGPFQALPRNLRTLDVLGTVPLAMYRKGSRGGDFRLLLEVKRAVEGGGVGYIVADDDSRWIGRAEPCELFGEPVHLATGFAQLAAKTRAVVVPSFILDHGGQAEVRFLPPLAQETGPGGGCTRTLVQSYVSVLEQMLRNHPGNAVEWGLGDRFERLNTFAASPVED